MSASTFLLRGLVAVLATVLVAFALTYLFP
jgi:hypothetical protein